MMDAGFQLGVGEKMLWTGKPRQGLLLRRSDRIAIPASLLWCACAIFWEITVMARQMPLMFQLWKAPFLVVGLYLVLGRFFIDAASRARTNYAVTNQRILIAGGLWARHTTSLALSSLGEVALLEGRGSTGTITFGPQNPARRHMPAGLPLMGQWAPVFDMIDGARNVHELIRRAQQAAK
jgi:hypothetical protein